MSKGTRVLASVALLLTLGIGGRSAEAQRAMPAPAFSTTDLANLRWIEGRWRGSASGEPPFFESYRFTDDSTIEIAYYSDEKFTRATGGGRVYLSGGRIFHTSGAGRWGASHISKAGVYFVPQANATNTFNWVWVSADVWTATLRSAPGGQERVVVYKMDRVK